MFDVRRSGALPPVVHQRKSAVKTLFPHPSVTAIMDTMPEDSPHQPHDKLFKAGFSDPATAGAFLRLQFSEALASKIGWDTLRLEPANFVDSHFRESESDLLFSAPLGDARCLVYLLFEHQRAKDPWIALRLLRYMLRIWEKHLHDHPEALRLPVILPVVVAQNAGR